MQSFYSQQEIRSVNKCDNFESGAGLNMYNFAKIILFE